VHKSKVLYLRHVKVIKKGVLIHPSKDFAPEELEDFKGRSPKTPKSRSEQESSTQM